MSYRVEGDNFQFEMLNVTFSTEFFDSVQYSLDNVSNIHLTKCAYLLIKIQMSNKLDILCSFRNVSNYLFVQIQFCPTNMWFVRDQRSGVEIMVEPGNLVPSQKPEVAAIFRQNLRKISNLYTYICLQQLVYIYLSAATCKPTSVCSHLYTYICLQQFVYLHLSAAFCIPTYV